MKDLYKCPKCEAGAPRALTGFELIGGGLCETLRCTKEECQTIFQIIWRPTKVVVLGVDESKLL